MPIGDRVVRTIGFPRVSTRDPDPGSQEHAIRPPCVGKVALMCLRLSGFERVNCRPTRAHHEPLRSTPLSSTTALYRRIHSARNRRVLLNLTVVAVLGLVLAFSACGSSSSNSRPTLPAAAPRPARRTPNPRPTAPRRRSCRPCRAVRPCRSSAAQRSATPSGRLRVLARATLSSSCSGTAPNGTPRTPRASAAPHRRACPSRSCPTARRPRPRLPRGRSPQACTSEAILAALPAGATMQKFTCADVGGKLWAAARVSPGNTVFFLRWNGTKWNAQDSQSICGTASAGLPQSLLSYCKAAPSSSPTRPVTAGLHVRGDSCRAPGRRHDEGVHLRRRRWQAVGRCAC